MKTDKVVDAKKMADRMRVTAQLIEALAPFDKDEQQQIIAGVFMMLELHKGSPLEEVINRAFRKAAERG